MGVWFSASAVVPALASQWHLSAGAAAWLTAPVQAGFVAGAIVSAVSGLADRMRPHLLVAGCAAGAAACTLVMALFADGPLAAVPLRFATGTFLAGVYPVGMKLMVSWSRPAGRALAMGVLIGCPDPGLGPAAPDRWPVAAELARGPRRGRGGRVRRGDRRRRAGQAGPAVPPGRRRRPRPAMRWPCSLTAVPAWSISPTSGTCGSCTRSGHGCRRSWPRAAPPRPGCRPWPARVAGHRGLPRDRRRRGGWLPDRRLGRRPSRPRRHRRRGAGRQRRMLPALTAVLHRQPPLAARLRGGVGRGRHRRLRRVLHPAERARRPPLHRNRADRPDSGRVRADHRHDPG